MAEQSRDNHNKVNTKRPKKRLRIITIVVLAILSCILLWLIIQYKSVDEQLAAIDAARAIPDSENAAVFYMRLFSDIKNTNTLDDFSPYTLSAYVEPWTDSEHPQLAAKLNKHNKFIETLIDISEMQEARFPVYPDLNFCSFVLADIRRATFILSMAAANDLAEGRIDAAYSKYRCQFKLARHLEQQPATLYRTVGIANKAIAFENIRRAVMRDEITTEQLRSLEMILEIPLNRDEADAEIATRVNRLIEKKERSQQPLANRLKEWWRAFRTRRQDEKRQHQIRLRMISIERAIQILIALRRHKEKTGVWPQTLEQIEPKLSQQMLTDPHNNGSFIYKRNGDDFVFYSKGYNNIDEGGSRSGPPDDYPIWPPGE